MQITHNNHYNHQLQQGIAVATTSSRVASLLLPAGGSTAQNKYGIDLDNTNNTKDCKCHLKMNNNAAKVLRQAVLHVWDEGPMMTKHCFTTVEKLLKDVMRTEQGQAWREHMPFAGRTRHLRTSRVNNNWLLDLGNGKLDNPLIIIPPHMVVPGKEELHLIKAVYGDLTNDASLRTPEALFDKAVLIVLSTR
ncbi:hypothetical protein CEUSTIGMA_g6855.t1 [Chlamydomonas eustigma]|uniref:ATP-dependent DNA helicase n=1 Tax=Chlamydomonas eustigma TaxID=1157962 RepID=A0A250X8L4_9CHLO|nr:hypothetical protein CEUSTIGMA_g6855.t1 [Chlamydomonas eustigma]|eukprot:GAX79414.1 hypothetical protein CEUSTIGMA_g6855.t1 [Chlamydomonas eustigma]